MAFAITAFQCYPAALDVPHLKRALQHVELTITGTTADVALDFNNLSGTFWTAAGASGIGATALSYITKIKSQADHQVSFYLQGVTDGKQLVASATAPATTQYRYTSTTAIPSLALFAAEGLTSYKLHLVVSLSDGYVGYNYF